MEASALARASRGGLLARRSPLLRFEPDERLIKLIRAGHDGAFEALFNRYHSRLLAFCNSMLKSRQDAEDVLQEVFANAHAAMLGDERAINVRPWLYRIARNRCLNHLRKPVPEGQDSMDIHPHQNGTTTAEHVQNREELRQVLADVRTLPETQRTALLLREIDQLCYEEIAQAMDTTVPSIKSLLVRARIGLAESSKARMLTCDEVQVELAEAAEGIARASGPARKHVRSCDGCREFRSQLRADRKALAALFPLGPLALIKHGVLSKLFGGGATGGSGVAGSGAVGGGAVGGAAGGVSGVSGGIGILGSAIGAKAAAGIATAALLTAGAVEVRNLSNPGADNQGSRDPSTVASLPVVPPPVEHTRPEVLFTPATGQNVSNISDPATGHDSAPAPAPAAAEPQGPVPDRAADDGQAPAAGAEPTDGGGDVTIGGTGEIPTTEGVHDDQDPGRAPVGSIPPTTIPVATTPPPTTPAPATPPPTVVPPVPVPVGTTLPAPPPLQPASTPPPAAQPQD